MHRVLRVPLTTDGRAFEALWTLRRQQSQTYNLGVELGLATESAPSPYDGFKELTRRRADGRLPRHSVALQRGGLRLGLEAVKRHRDSRRRLEWIVNHWSGECEQGNPKAAARLDRARQRLERHVARGTQRLFRTRKSAERTRGPALVYHERVRLDRRALVLPGGLRFEAVQAVEIPEGWTFSGAVQLVDVTQRITRRTGPRHRRYVAMLSLKAPDPQPEPPACREDIVGIDAGVSVPVMTSEGVEHHLPDESDLDAKQRSAGSARSRRRHGSRRGKRAARKLRAIGRRLSGRRRNASRQVAARVAATPHTTVAAEDLQVENMTRSARGTAQHPGKGVAQKRGLNRSLRRVAFRRLLDDVERACRRNGTGFIQVPAAGTSRACHRCGAEGRRETQALFVCPGCGWSGNADLNAALNVRERAWETAAGAVVERRSAGGNPVISQGRQE